MKQQFLFTMCVVLALIFGFANVSPALAVYTPTDLGTLDGSNSYPVALNEAGQVVGTSWLASNELVQPVQAKIAENYGQLPMSFEQNNGQSDAQVKFISRGAGYSLFLTPTEAVLALHKSAVTEEQNQTPLESALAGPEEEQAVEQTALHMQLVGANAAPQILGLEELPGEVNYLLGDDPAQWRTNVPTFAKVRYQAVYPGVDLIYYGNQGQLEYDFVVAPGADPNIITLGFTGIDKLEVDAHGELVLHIAGEQVRMHKPVIYQEWDGQREEIPGNYKLLPMGEGNGEGLARVGFQLGAYDTGRSLVIDPVLTYSTYLGGANTSGFLAGYGIEIAVDASGNAYVAGRTLSPIFPIVNAAQPTFGGFTDVFVTKLDATGAFIYSTYLGGSSDDAARSLSVDTSGNAYVAGFTFSPNFPIANAAQSTFGGGMDTFAAKLDAAGAFVYSTYLGGSSRDFLDTFGDAFAVDASGNAYLMGLTSSPNFPIVNAVQSTFGGGFQDVFVTKLNATGAFIYSTYLGGSSSDSARNLAVDGSGNAYVAGNISSPNFPTANAVQPTFGGGLQDGFLAKLNATGAFVYSTYLGGSGSDPLNDIAVDGSGNAYVAGSTNSPNFPTVNAAQPTLNGSGDAFVAKLNATGAFAYSTYLGGSNGESPQFGGLVVDGSGNASVVGFTNSTNFPTVNAAQPTFGGGTVDFFVTKLNATGAFAHSTYLGGGGSESGANGSIDVALDGSGNLYIHGATASSNFPTANAVQSTFGGGSQDNFVTKMDATGAFVYSTYLGGNGNESAINPGLAVDGSGNAYVAGSTTSPNFPIANAVQPTFGGSSDVFVVNLDVTGAFVYSTYLGGNGSESTSDTGLVVDTSGNVYLTGNTFSPNFPLQNAAQSTFGDIFVAKISPNQAPSTDAGGPYSVDEGASVTVTASGSDPESGTLTYAWNLDNNGTFETSGQSVNFSAASLDGPSNHTITVQVTDEGGLTATASTTVDVLNVAPTADFTGTPGTLFVGQSATLAFSNPFDPSGADTTAGFQYSYDCTNDGSFELSDSAAASYACAYPASGTFTSSGRIQDKDGDFTDYTVQITALTPREGTEGLIDQVKSLMAQGTLSEGHGNALLAKLDGVLKQLEKGKTKTAINELEAFINQVNSFMTSTPPILPPEEGQPLIDAAHAIIAALGS